MPFGVRNFRPSATVVALASDDAGFLWVATLDGLYRFDGRRFTPYNDTTSPALDNRFVHQIVPAKSGDLWLAMGTTAAPLVVRREGLPEQHKAPQLIRFGAQGVKQRIALPPEMIVYGGAAGPRDHIWMATNQGLLAVDEYAGHYLALPPHLGSAEIKALAFVGEQAGWVATDRGLARVPIATPSQAELVIAEMGLAALSRTADGKLWMLNGHELILADLEPVPKVVARYACPNSASRLHGVQVDGEQTPWVLSDHGLWRLQGGQLTPLPPSLAPADPLPLAQTPAATSGMWIGTRSQGLVGIIRPLVVAFAGAQGLSDGPVSSVIADPHTGVWAATPRGLFRGGMGGFEPVTGWPKQLPASALAFDAAESLWVGVPGGVMRYDERRKHLERLNLRLNGGLMPTSILHADGTLWLGWPDGKVTKLHPASTEAALEIGITEGLCAGGAHQIVPGDSDTVRVASDGGVATIHGDRARCLGHTGLLEFNQVTSLATGSDGALWVGTRFESGIKSLREGRVESFTEADGLPCGSVHHLLNDGMGGLWLGCIGGVARLSVGSLQRLAADRSLPLSDAIGFDRRDGMLAEEVTLSATPGVVVDKQSTVWAATMLGAVAIDSKVPAGGPPSLRLDTAMLGTNRLQPQQRGDHLRLTVKVLAALPHNPERLKLSYVLDGHHGSTEPGADLLTAVFENVGPGTHVFEARANVGSGQWSRALRLTFVVSVPLYRTRFAWATALAACAAALALINRRRLILARKGFAAVAAERTRMARELHDTMAQGFTGVSFTLDALGRADTSVSAEDANRIQRCKAIIIRMRADLRRAIWDLREPANDARPFKLQMKEVLRKFATAHKVATQLHFDGEPQLQGMAAAELLAILKESLTNIAEHAKATSVVVWLRVEPGAIVMTVQDDGVGMAATRPEEARAEGHFGVVGMRERAKRCGGQVDLIHLPGGGTRIEVVIGTKEHA